MVIIVSFINMIIYTSYNTIHFTKTLYYLYNKSDKINMLQITENEILEAYDAFELTESELIELYSEGYISENTMDQLIEMGVFDEFLYEQEELEEGVLKRHGKSMLKRALVAGALGAGAGALATGALPVAAAVGATTGIGHLVGDYIDRKQFDKKKLDDIRYHRKIRDGQIKDRDIYLNKNRANLGMNSDRINNARNADFHNRTARAYSTLAKMRAKEKFPSIIDVIKRKNK